MDLGAVYFIEFSALLKYVSVYECLPLARPGATPFPTSASILSFRESVFISRIRWVT